MSNTIKELIHNFSVNSDFREVWNITIKDVGIKIGIPTGTYKVDKETPHSVFLTL